MADKRCTPPHFTQMPTWLLALPIVNWVLSSGVLGLCAYQINVTPFSTGVDEGGLACSILEIAGTVYIVITELMAKDAYNYYAAVILSAVFFAMSMGFSISWSIYEINGSEFAQAVTGAGGNVALAPVPLVRLCVSWVNSVVFLLYFIILAVFITRHREQGGHCRCEKGIRHKKCTPQAYVDCAGNVQSAQQTHCDPPIDQIHPQHLQLLQHGSVHYKQSDPYHPLRLNPADGKSHPTTEEISDPNSTRDQASGRCCDHYLEGQEGDLEANSQPCALCEEEANLPVEDHNLAHCPTIQIVSSQEQLREHILDQCLKKRDSTLESIRGHDLNECVKAGAPEPSRSHTLEQCGATRVSSPESLRGHTLEQCATIRVSSSERLEGHDLEECNEMASSPEHPQSHGLHQCVEARTTTPQNFRSHEIDACPTIRVSPPENPSNHELEYCPTTQVTSEASQSHRLENCPTTEMPLQSPQDHRMENCSTDQVALEGPQSHTLAQCPIVQAPVEGPRIHQLSQCTTAPMPGSTELKGHSTEDCVTIQASPKGRSQSHSLEDCVMTDSTSRARSQSHSLENCVALEASPQARSQSHSLDECPPSSASGNVHKDANGSNTNF
ncbi:hypothetical protein B0J14DRAFT_121684 [Halenospora varia]|nr:hypothetical protein B0J14DRAFT_121684 [Halenospora varia]